MRKVNRSVSRLLPLISFAKRSDIDEYLKMHNIDLEKEKYLCYVCGETITRDNIGIIFSKEGSIKTVCNKSSCLDKINIYSLHVHY